MNLLRNFGNFLIRWIVESGFIQQLATLVTSTAILRHIVMWIGGALVTHGIVGQQYAASEVAIGIGITILSGSLTMFIEFVRNKYAIQAQLAAGAKPDSFVGPKTVEAIKSK